MNWAAQNVLWRSSAQVACWPRLSAGPAVPSGAVFLLYSATTLTVQLAMSVTMEWVLRSCLVSDRLFIDTWLGPDNGGYDNGGY